MIPLELHEFHASLNASFGGVNGVEIVADFGDPEAEYQALRGSVGVLDLSCRGRVCVIGTDRVRFLNGQVTNNVKDLHVGQGCYAALVNAKGRLQSDLNIHILDEEILLDFEPGMTAAVIARLDQYVIADDVQVIDVSAQYGLLSVQGPRAREVIPAVDAAFDPLPGLWESAKHTDAALGELHLMNRPRFGTKGFDLFVPVPAMAAVADRLIAAARNLGGQACGWTPLERVRIEAGIPRFGLDMDESNLAPEAGLESTAISYSKGCYIGQEVIARIRTYGQVAKALRGLRMAADLPDLPERGDLLLHDGREVGYLTSVVRSPRLEATVALGYVRREVNEAGTRLTVRTARGETEAVVSGLPFG